MKVRYGLLFPYVARQWRKFILIGVVTIAASGIVALEPLPLKLLVDHALGGASAPQFLNGAFRITGLRLTPTVLIFAAAGFSLLFFLLSSSIDALLSWAWMSAGQRMVYDLSSALFYKMQRLPFGFHARQPVGDSLGRLAHDTWSIYTLTAGVVSPLQAVLTLVTVGLIAYRLDPELAMLSLVVAPALAFISVVFGPKIKQRAQIGREVESRLMSFVHQTLEAIPIVQAFGTETRNRQRFSLMADDAITVSRKGALLGGTYRLITGLLLAAGAAVVLYVGGRRVLSGVMPLGTLLVFLSYISTMQITADALLRTFSDLKPVEASIERVLQVLEFQDHVAEIAGARQLVEPSRGRIAFENVTFGYEADAPVLKGVTLTIRPGERIAIAGTSGAGKTTLVSLVPRFFDPWEGRVTLDGTDVRDIQTSSLRDQVGYVLQEPFLLPRSVAENIAFGRPHASRREIEAAAEAANADDFIRCLPEGYDTVIGQRGMTLSGGERQRLSIARAILKSAPILIVDEPTAALDAATEAEVLDAIDRLMAGRTTLIVTHRLSTAQKADRIVMLERGRIVEVGSHPELFAAGGRYHELYSLQHHTSASTVTA